MSASDGQTGVAVVDLVLSALPHLTGDELRRVAEAMPRVAGEWVRYDDDNWGRRIEGWSVAFVSGTHGENWRAWTEGLGLGGDATFHPTARTAQAACDARLEAAGVRLCGEVVRDG